MGRDGVHCPVVSVFFVEVLRMLGSSHSAAGGGRGTLGLFELFSSSLPH